MHEFARKSMIIGGKRLISSKSGQKKLTTLSDMVVLGLFFFIFVTTELQISPVCKFIELLSDWSIYLKWF